MNEKIHFYAPSIQDYISPVLFCVAIGAGTAGIGGLACLVIVGGTASYVGSELGSAGGEAMGNKVYEVYGK